MKCKHFNKNLLGSQNISYTMINTCHHKKRIIENARAREAGKRDGQNRGVRETGKEAEKEREKERKNDKKIDERSSTIQSTNRRRIDST